jgi:hypothetical protein
MADRVAAFFEATQLAGFTPLEANRHFGMPRGVPGPLKERLDAWTPYPWLRHRRNSWPGSTN